MTFYILAKKFFFLKILDDKGFVLTSSKIQICLCGCAILTTFIDLN